MPDWLELVRQRLSGLDLDSAERDEVHAELAAHLEESYEVLCKKGLPEREAVYQTFERVGDWEDLRRRIFLAKRRKHPMQKRMHQLWIPGFLTLILFVIFQMTFQKLGLRPRIVGSGPTAILIYVPWLLSLPFFGALGACLSSREGASRPTTLIASCFPVLALTMAFLLMFPIGLVVERVTGINVGFSIVATALLQDGIGWLVVPGVALFVGGLLADVLFGRRTLSSRRRLFSGASNA